MIWIMNDRMRVNSFLFKISLLSLTENEFQPAITTTSDGPKIMALREQQCLHVSIRGMQYLFFALVHVHTIF